MKIAACPFCESKRLELVCEGKDGFLTYFIQCQKCFAQGPTNSKPKMAEFEWTNRPEQKEDK